MLKKIGLPGLSGLMLIMTLMLTLLILFSSPDVMAQTTGGRMATIGSMFANFAESARALIKLVQASAFVVGSYLLIGSVFKMLAVSNGKAEIKTPITMFFCGIALLSIMSSFSVISETMSMPSGPGDVLISGGTGGFTAQTAAAMTGVLTFVQLLGYIAFVRGFLLLNSGGAGKEGALGRGLTHLFGGVAAINIKLTAKIIATTIAPQALRYIT